MLSNWRTGPKLRHISGGFTNGEEKRDRDVGLIALKMNGPKIWECYLALWVFPLDCPEKTLDRLCWPTFNFTDVLFYMLPLISVLRR